MGSQLMVSKEAALYPLERVVLSDLAEREEGRNIYGVCSGDRRAQVSKLGSVV